MVTATTDDDDRDQTDKAPVDVNPASMRFRWAARGQGNRRLRVPAAHRPPVLARAKLSGKIRELIYERAYLAVVANHQRLNLPEPEQAALDGAGVRVRHCAAVPQCRASSFRALPTYSPCTASARRSTDRHRRSCSRSAFV